MPENPETKPEEAKQGEKPSEKPQEHVEQAKGSRKYVDYDNVSPQEASVMLKRIRARVKRIEKDIDAIMAILKYGANAGAPQGQSEGQYQRQYQGRQGYQRNYRRNYGYNRYGGRRYSQHRRNEEDVNYE